MPVFLMNHQTVIQKNSFLVHALSPVACDALGSFLYGVFYLELGVLFSNEVNGLLELISRFGVASAILAFALFMIWVAYKYVRRRKALKPPSEPAVKALATISGT